VNKPTRPASLAAFLVSGIFLAALVLMSPDGAAQTTAATTEQSVAQAGATTTEVVENPYGLDALWRQGDYIARGTLIILLIMSVGSWYVIATKLVEQARLMDQARLARKSVSMVTPTPGDGPINQGNPFHLIAESGARALEEHKRVAEQVDLHTWTTIAIQRSIETIQSRLQGGLAFLATVGSTAPFVGLFGTVWGIYHALTAIGIAGQASIDKVAGPVGEALIMTAFGLAVAVPAVLGYNWLVRRNKLAMESVRSFSGETLAVLMSRAQTGQLREVANVTRVGQGNAR